MCGIVACVTISPPASANGFNGSNGTNSTTIGHHKLPSKKKLEEILDASLDTIAHRGPDAKGIWVSDDGRVGLGHCRLSINDVSPDGNQPLNTADDMITAIVNGEIYNHDTLREQLARDHGYQFTSHSDSEVALALYAIHGAPGFLPHLIGEFAMVLHDRREPGGKIIIVRDRFGIKPLFWTLTNDCDGRRLLLLASEAKALKPFGWQPEWDVASIVEGGVFEDNRTLFKGVSKIPPGHWTEVTSCGEMVHRQYWDSEFKDKTKPENRSIDDMVFGVREHLLEATRLRLRADVPVGIYLSGGIDSSVIAGMATELVKKHHVKLGNEESDKVDRVHCFSIRFPPESGLDESDIAERSAAHLGVTFISEDMTEARLADNFADSAYHIEHHHCDLNSVGKFILSTAPRAAGVRVVLTGEGADELFGGYPFFPSDYLREPDLSMPDDPLTRDDELRNKLYHTYAGQLKAIVPRLGGFDHGISDIDSNLLDGCLTTACVLGWHPTGELFTPWVQKKWAGYDSKQTVIDSVVGKKMDNWHPLHVALYLYTKGPLANLLLTALGDRTEMAHSVEARTPFLDHRVVEYVNGLPPSVKMAYRNGMMVEKWILREAARPYITEELYSRPKHAYSAPLKWSKDGALFVMLKELLTREAVEELGFVDWGVVEGCFEKGFGQDADVRSFRILLIVGSWVVLGQRLGVRKADLQTL